MKTQLGTNLIRFPLFVCLLVELLFKNKNLFAILKHKHFDLSLAKVKIHYPLWF